MAGKPRILFVINSLAGGGAERVLMSLLSFSRDMLDDYDFSLCLLDQEKREYPAPEWLTVHQRDSRGSLIRSARTLDALVREERPDLILSFLTRANCASVIVARRHGLRSVISERVETSSHLAHGLSGWVARAIVRLAYPRADHVIAVSQGIADDLSAHYGVSRDHMSVIANPVDMARIGAEGDLPPAFALPDRFAVAVSRLTPTKNVMLVVDALARARIDLSLVILGQGPERDAIIARATALGIADRVILAGFCPNPYAIMKCASFFVSGSNAEGFPNGLVEALALGLPVVATNCASGPSEILADAPREAIDALTLAEFGILVPPNDVAALAVAMERVSDEQTRQRYVSVAQLRAAAYAPERAKRAYWRVVEDMLRRV